MWFEGRCRAPAEPATVADTFTRNWYYRAMAATQQAKQIESHISFTLALLSLRVSVAI